MPAPEDPLTNSQIAELLAIAGDDAKPPLNRAYRRASRKALLWEEEAACLYQEGRALTELPGVGPYLEKIIRRWIEVPPIVARPPRNQRQFLYANAGPIHSPRQAALVARAERGFADAQPLERRLVVNSGDGGSG